jgi:flagellin
MGFRINTNVLSLNAQRNLGISARAFAKSLQQLSSGSRINRAGDDAAGLAISEGLASQVRGTAVAIRNANDAIGFLNTAEGGLAELTNITQRLRELSVQASNGTLGSSDRTYLNSEAQQLISEFDRIATQTQFNGSFLLDGSFTTTNLQVGVQKGQTIAFNIGNARASALGALATISGVRDQITAAVSGLQINGTAIANTQASDDAFSSSGNSYSAIAIAKQINVQSGTTKVYADIQTTIVQGNNLTFSSYQGDLSYDGFKINGISLTGTGINNVNSFITAVNNFSNQTGVKARLQSNATSSVEFYADDGRNIQIQWSASGASTGMYGSWNDTASSNVSAGGISVGLIFTATLLSSATVSVVRTGAIKLRSSAAITINASQSATLGFSSTSIAVDSTVAVNSVTLTTQDNASNALSVLDATLSQLNALRSGLGATQSRLDSTVSNLGVTLENISSARSQIRDTDVATATADLTRAQILQEAGIAVLGQANSSSQAALKLLQNL